MKPFVRLVLLGLAVHLPLPANAALQQLTNLFVFGDSLSDAGNSGLRSQEFTNNPNIVFPPPPYSNGQFSNGPVAVQYLWDLYNPGNTGAFKPSLAGGTDYAIGGATTGVENYNSLNPNVPGFLQPAYAQFGTAWELQEFEAGHPAFDPATSLFVVWLFPNDVFYNSATGNLPGVVPGSPGGSDLVSNGIANIAATITTLAAAGAQHFLVPNMPDLGELPEFRGTADAPLLSFISGAFDTNLGPELSILAHDLSVEIVQFDTAAAFNQILGDPAAYGFTNATDPCFNAKTDTVCATPDTYVFWDGVHGTTKLDQILGANFAAAVPEPDSLTLVTFALLALAIGRSRSIHKVRPRRRKALVASA